VIGEGPPCSRCQPILLVRVRDHVANWLAARCSSSAVATSASTRCWQAIGETGSSPHRDPPASDALRRLHGRSAYPPTTDIRQGERHVRKVPEAEVSRPYSITSLASTNAGAGIVNPSVRAALRFTTNSNFSGWAIGRSPGAAPFRILWTYERGAAKLKLYVPRCLLKNLAISVNASLDSGDSVSRMNWKCDMPSKTCR
jgi:hypothetical protein